VALLLQVSVARHVRVAANVFPQSELVTVSTITRVTFAGSHISNAVGTSKFQGVPHSTIRFVPQLSNGGVVSTTVMVWLQEVVLLQLSVACHVRVAANVFPQSELVTVPVRITATFVPSHPSVAAGISKSHATPHSTILFVAQVNTGDVVSTTVIVWLQVTTLLQVSVTSQVRVAANVFPQVAFVTVLRTTSDTLVLGHGSTAVGRSKSQGVPHSTTLFVGQAAEDKYHEHTTIPAANARAQFFTTGPSDYPRKTSLVKSGFRLDLCEVLSVISYQTGRQIQEKSTKQSA